LLILLLVAACSDGGPPASTYRHMEDRLWAASGLGAIFDHQPCWRTIKGVPENLPVADCYRMLPPQRMRGVWLNEFEGSKFFPGYSTDPGPSLRSTLWLEVDRPAISRITGRNFNWRSKGPQPKLVLLDFIGRRTAISGPYGHMGMSDHYVVVDRILSAQVLDEPAVKSPQID
jgi:hypothetical protein